MPFVLNSLQTNYPGNIGLDVQKKSSCHCDEQIILHSGYGTTKHNRGSLTTIPG